MMKIGPALPPLSTLVSVLCLAAATSLLGGCGSEQAADERNNAVDYSARPLPAKLSAQADEARESIGAAPMFKAKPRIGVMPVQYQSPELAGDRYAKAESSRVHSVAEAPLTTFSIDVDTASYANVRRFVVNGRLPPKGAVRAEEFINYFTYGFSQSAKASAASPFKLSYEVAKSPWNSDRQLLMLALDSSAVELVHKPSNLVFLLDVSGSMNSPDRLPLVRRSLKMLLTQLDDQDRVAIVVYAGAAGVVLEPTRANERATIVGALEQLSAGGSTNGGEGLRQAYRLAQQAFIEGGNNRVILATDGDFNVGVSGTDELRELVQRQAKQGVELTVLGFGRGNYNDQMMEQISNWGNGNAAYIDTLLEARKVLVEQLGATLQTVASDVKIQLEFNPQQVTEYRLIGYQNRMLANEDFNNDKVDAGEIGAGHTVTAIYELTLTGAKQPWLPALHYAKGEAESSQASATEYGLMKLRYKLPGQSQSRLVSFPLRVQTETVGSVDFNFAAAVAAYAERLCCDKYLGDFAYAAIEQLAQQGRGDDIAGYRAEFIRLVQQTALIEGVED